MKATPNRSKPTTPSITKWWKERKEMLNLRNKQQEVLKMESDSELKRRSVEKEWQQGLAELQQKETTEREEQPRRAIERQEKEAALELGAEFERKKAELQQNERKKARILQLVQNLKSPRPTYNFWTEQLSKEDVIRLNQQGEGECPICLEEFKEGQVIKGSYCWMHSFHKKCIDDSVYGADIKEGSVVLNNEKEKCPMCRRSFKIPD